ncbi:hypothetical protein Pam2_109 [Pseudanabaena phage Pam2]|nr:hypothetical protein Pam2_109 [Pseudanabaena phage Pam2]
MSNTTTIEYLLQFRPINTQEEWADSCIYKGYESPEKASEAIKTAKKLKGKRLEYRAVKQTVTTVIEVVT